MRLKDIPLQVLKEIVPIMKHDRQLFERIDKENCIFHAIDNDEGSSFFFTMEKEDKTKILLRIKPANSGTSDAVSLWSPAEEVQKYFQEWLNCLKEYSELEKQVDDSFVREYADAFYEEFTISDVDVETKPFDLTRQIFLYDFLDSVSQKLIASKNDENIDEVTEMTAEIKYLQENIGRYSKEIVMRKFSEIIGKTRKYAFKIFKEIYNEFKKEAIKQLVSVAINKIIE